MSAFNAIVKRELKSVTREKTIMIAIVLQLFIASFASAILVEVLSFYDPDSIGLNARANLRVGLIGNVGSPLAQFLKESHVQVTTFSAPTDADNAFRIGAIDAVLLVPENNGGVVEMKLFLPSAESFSSLILMMLKEPMKRYENYLREERGIHVRYSDITGLPSTTFEFLYLVVIPALMFFPAFIAGSMVIDSIAEELENHTLETLWSAPLSLNVIFGAKIFAALVLAVSQCVLWVMLLRLNRIDIQNVCLVLLAATVVAAITAIGSALTVMAFKDRERSQFMYSLLILLAVGAGHLWGFSPLKLMTQLSIGDYYTGIVDVAKYGLVLLVSLFVFLRTTSKFVAV